MLLGAQTTSLGVTVPASQVQSLALHEQWCKRQVTANSDWPVEFESG
jgi:hypothetical protein